MTKTTRRRLIGAALVFMLLLMAVVGRPVFHLVRACWRDRGDTVV